VLTINKSHRKRQVPVSALSALNPKPTNRQNQSKIKPRPQNMKTITPNIKSSTGSAPLLKAAVAALAIAGLTAGSHASLITSDPSLPPLGGAYLTPSQVHTTYGGGALTIVLSQIQHQPFAQPPPVRIPDPSHPANELETFDSGVTGLVSVNGSPDMPLTLTGPVQTEVFGKTGNVTGTFNTEMLSMDLSGNTGFGPVMIRESPTLASTGQTTITDIGGGQYRIDSFFDIFTELSVDGGATWIPSTSSTHVDLEAVPEPATLATGLGLLGVAALKRRRSVRP
jgi:hypothetical protein